MDTQPHLLHSREDILGNERTIQGYGKTFDGEIYSVLSNLPIWSLYFRQMEDMQDEYQSYETR